MKPKGYKDGLQAALQKAGIAKKFAGKRKQQRKSKTIKGKNK